MAMNQDFLQVPVSREDRSYRTVYSLFHKTVSETKFRIIKIDPPSAEPLPLGKVQEVSGGESAESH